MFTEAITQSSSCFVLVLFSCISVLKKYIQTIFIFFLFLGLHVLGIFRVGGSKKRVKQVKYFFVNN